MNDRGFTFPFPLRPRRPLPVDTVIPSNGGHVTCTASRELGEWPLRATHSYPFRGGTVLHPGKVYWLGVDDDGYAFVVREEDDRASHD